MILFISNFLTQHGYNPTFLEIISNDLSNKFSVLNISNKKNKLIRLFDMLFQFHINKKSIKLVIIDTYSTDAYYFSLMLSFMCYFYNKPYILVLSGGDLGLRLNKSHTFKFIINYARKIVTPSKYLFEIFEKYDSNIIYLPNYLNLDLYEFKDRKLISPKILWVRSIHKIYNPLMAVFVLKKIKKFYPKVTLCMVGPIKDNSINEINALVKRDSLEKNIFFKKKLEKNEWIELSKEFDIFINTTNYDNHPVSILEAMALGMPIVSTNAGGIPKLLEHNITAKLVEVNDASSMADSILEYILNDKERVKICLKAREKIESEFDKSIIINKWHKMISDIVS